MHGCGWNACIVGGLQLQTLLTLCPWIILTTSELVGGFVVWGIGQFVEEATEGQHSWTGSVVDTLQPDWPPYESTAVCVNWVREQYKM